MMNTYPTAKLIKESESVFEENELSQTLGPTAACESEKENGEFLLVAFILWSSFAYTLAFVCTVYTCIQTIFMEECNVASTNAAFVHLWRIL